MPPDGVGVPGLTVVTVGEKVNGGIGVKIGFGVGYPGVDGDGVEAPGTVGSGGYTGVGPGLGDGVVVAGVGSGPGGDGPGAVGFGDGLLGVGPGTVGLGVGLGCGGKLGVGLGCVGAGYVGIGGIGEQGVCVGDTVGTG